MVHSRGRIPCVALLVAMMTLTAGGIAIAQKAGDGPKRFLAVPKWYVTYSITIAGSGDWTTRDREGFTTNTTWRIQRNYSGSYTVRNQHTNWPRPGKYGLQDGPIPRGRFVAWTSEPGEKPESFMSPFFASIRDHITTRSTGVREGMEIVGPEHRTVRKDWEGRGSWTGSADEGVYVDVVDGTYSLHIPYSPYSPKVPKILRETEIRELDESPLPSDPPETREELVPLNMIKAPDILKSKDNYLVKDQPLPPGGNVLKGQLPVPMRIAAGTGGRGFGGDEIEGIATIAWTCSPDPPLNVNLVLSADDPAEYEHWRPKGAAKPAPGKTLEETPGNTVRVRARLQGIGFGQPAIKARVFRFELVKVSNEKGVCLNAPLEAAKNPGPDLKFVPEGQPQGIRVPSAEGQTANQVGADLVESEAIVTAFDFGAYGSVKVTAELDNGEEIVGHLEGFPETEVLDLPKRDSDSGVADSWKSAHEIAGKSDDSDDDTIPVGDGHRGDGLTLFEEYRGFMVGDGWTDTDPTRKNLFVLDLVGGPSKSGINLFRAVSKLRVLDGLRITQLPENRVINFNHTAGPHLVDQHAVILDRVFWEPDGLAEGGPGTPKDVSRVYVGTLAKPLAGAASPQSEYANCIAHELLHCCNVKHHGDGDGWVTWQRRGTLFGNGRWVSEDGDTTDDAIVPTLETGQPASLDLWVWGDTGATQLWRGVEHGEGSGCDTCVMRYGMAECYPSLTDPKVRYVVMERNTPGSTLCTSPAGTGINATGHKPQSRYGAAAPGRGNCAGQICVNDAAHPAAGGP